MSFSPDLFDGLLLVDKPAGFTSHDVVAKIRRTFRIARVGHGGTLDPAATGLLIIMLGRATKLSDRLMGGDKTYSGAIRFGVTTASQDLDGEILSQAPVAELDRCHVEAEMQKLCGDIFQIPPMVSAIKLNGVPLYKMARKGQEVERQPRLVHIYKFELTAWNFPAEDPAFIVECTKGTYVRTLVHDIGQALGCGAALASLRRLASSHYTVADAAPLDELLALSPDALCARMIPFARAVQQP